MAKLYLPIVLFSFCLNSYAQQEVTDTLSLQNGQTITSIENRDNVSAGKIPVNYELNEAFDEQPDSISSKKSTPIIYIPGSFTGQAYLLQWNNGGLFANGQHNAMLGLMNHDNALLSMYHQLGKFTVSAFGSASKYSYFHGLTTQWGFGGSLSYQLTDNLSFTAFGEYYTTTGIAQPSMLGYVSTPVFGGYADYHIEGSHFGIQAGAQAYYNQLTQRWEPQPIVMPYYRTSSGAKLGIDVGGIIYHVIRNKTHTDFNGSRNPTIAPPKMSTVPDPIRR
jgi:hypothetical protein